MGGGDGQQMGLVAGVGGQGVGHRRAVRQEQHLLVQMIEDDLIMLDDVDRCTAGTAGRSGSGTELRSQKF